MQIETGEALANVRDIAAVDGVDVLFVGPLDLSVSMGMPGRFEDPEFLDGLRRVSAAAGDAGIAAGILLPHVGLIETVHEMGFTFVAVGSDGGMVMASMGSAFGSLSAFKEAKASPRNRP